MAIKHSLTILKTTSSVVQYHCAKSKNGVKATVGLVLLVSAIFSFKVLSLNELQQVAHFHLASASHTENLFTDMEGNLLGAKWYMISTTVASAETAHLTFERFGVSPILVKSLDEIPHPEAGYFNIILHQVVLGRPHYNNLLQRALYVNPFYPVKISVAKDAWVVVSRRKINSSEIVQLPLMELSPPETMNGKLIAPYTVFVPSQKAWNLIWQAEQDYNSDRPHIKVLSQQDLHNNKPMYRKRDTAYVYTFIAIDGSDQCDPLSMSPASLAGMMLSVHQVRKFSDRRIILFVQDSCADGFEKVLDSSMIPNVEVVTFQQVLDFAPQEIFGFAHYRASFYVKAYYLQKLNNYLKKPVKRLISVDWDYFPLQSMDHLFDVPVPAESLLATPGASHGSILNGGFLVFSPNLADDFIDFWQDMLKNYNGWHYTVKSANTLSGSEQEIFAYWYIKTGNYHVLPQWYNSLVKSYAVLKTQESIEALVEKLPSIHAGGYKPGKCLEKGSLLCKIVYERFEEDFNFLLENISLEIQV
ncbi:hypothetical protein P9112_001528 [Eukaryota sp. TZLM1-RC]